MKKLLLLVFFASMLVIAGCSKDDDDDNPLDPGGNGGTPTTISGKIDNWTLGAGKTISLTMAYTSTQSFGSAAVGTDGSFTIEAQPPTATAPLLNGVWNNPNCEGSVTVSPGDAYFIHGYFVVLENNNIIGMVYKEIDSENLSCVSHFFYVTKDVTVTGSETCSSESVSNYNMNFKKGWNLLYYVDDYSNQQTTVENTTTTEPAGAKYTFHSTTAF